MTLAVALPNWVGDAVMATPALAALRRGFPQAHITALMRPYVRAVLEGLDFADEIAASRALERGASAGVFLREALILRGAGFDAAVLFTNSFRTALLSRLAGVSERVGYAREGRIQAQIEEYRSQYAPAEAPAPEPTPGPTSGRQDTQP